MFKKILIAGVIFFGSISISLAGASLYVGPMLAYNSVSAGQINYEGLHPNLVLGFAGLLQNGFYLAGEVFAGPSSIAVKDRSTGGSLKTSYSYGISVLPSIILDDLVMSYLRIGTISTKFGQLKKRDGYQVGVGLELQLAESWNARGEYDYIEYNKISDVGRPRAGQYSISIIYRIT